MPLWKATVKMPLLGSLLARDVVENVWWFGSVGIDFETTITAITTRLESFYNDNAVTTGMNISNTMSKAIQRADVSILMARIDETNGEQLGDTTEIPITFNAADISALPLPNEVALCLSFEADGGVSTEPIRRRRGRVYLGPWDAAENVISTDAQRHGTPSDELVATIVDRADVLLDLSDADAFWAVYSRVAREVNAVSGGWVDNEWDTQRRRGTDASNRVLFPV